MANITKRINKSGDASYLIRVFIDEKSDGKQAVKSMTYKPELNLTQKQIDKKVNEVAVLFEQKVKQGVVAFDGSIKFADYASRWMDNAQIAPKTREGYELYLRRINAAIGHIKLQNIQAHHLDAFYKNLAEEGVKETGRFAITESLDKLMKDVKISQDGLSRLAGVATATIGVARKGNRISVSRAGKIAAALNIPVKELFMIHEETDGLSDKTILHHHRLISAILGKAKKERIIPYNVAVEHTTAPKVKTKEARYLDDVEAKRLVELLLSEDDIRVKTAILLSLCSGVRRGELCGLSWEDIDEKNGIIHIMKASQYLSGKGIVEVPTKNESSKRAIKIPLFMLDVLTQYKKWWLQQKLMNGSRWQGTGNRLFIQADGRPLFPDTINYWLDKFIEKHELEHFSPHSLRHTFSTLQIMAGVNIRTLQARTGHSQASTLTNIYAHAIKTADEMAANVLEDILLPNKRTV